ncbi:putative nucleotidyltransferase with HDIG domain [Chitinophaga skermanii]|uniref:Putative nucleotidyltransferase with HDIG domain n=2 Tax=Chitinophaga skermanii TaxID=331697 RepID=A0A327QQA7_9BACT|nr:putative nucleotidyltransferase with HDIG domain [Chitinophaga skermanii]
MDQLATEFDWVADMKGVPQDAIHHAEGDVFVHTGMVCAEMEQLILQHNINEQDAHILRAAALLHDVEKRSTTIIEPGGRITSATHARKGAATARQLLYRNIATPFAIREQICGLVRYHSLPLWAIEKHDPQRSVVEASFHVNTWHLSLLAQADVLGRISADRAELLLKIQLFEQLCLENECLGRQRAFTHENARFHYFDKGGDINYVPFDDFGSQVVLTSGLPGAGKDTHVRKHYADWPVINLDDIRKAHKISPTDKSGNGTVIQLAKEQAKQYLRKQQNFVWNATNITQQMRAQLVSLFVTYKAHVTIDYIEVPYKTLLKQNNNRPTAIPTAALERLVNKLEVPTVFEAHTVRYFV